MISKPITTANTDQPCLFRMVAYSKQNPGQPCPVGTVLLRPYFSYPYGELYAQRFFMAPSAGPPIEDMPSTAALILIRVLSSC